MSGKLTNIVCSQHSSQSFQARTGSQMAEIFEEYLVVGTVFSSL